MSDKIQELLLHTDDATLFSIAQTLAGGNVREDILRSQLRHVREEIRASQRKTSRVELCTQVQGLISREAANGIAHGKYA